MEQRLDEKLAKLENGIDKSFKVVNYTFETTMRAIDDSLQKTIHETEHTSKERHIKILDKLAKFEKDAKDHMEKVDMHLETVMQAMEDSLKKSVKANGDNIVNLNNQLITKMEQIQQQHDAQGKTSQKMSYRKLIKIEENKDALDMLTDSVRNINIQSKFNTQLLHMMHPVRSCRQALKVSGKYMKKIEVNSIPFEVLCEQNMLDGGWTVIQHRFNGSVDFYRNWTEYRNGFGNLDGEFWLGLEYVHQITKNRPHELLVEMKDFHGNYGYAKYEEFEIGNESEKYALKKLGKYSGTSGDAMRNDKDEKFSTFDQDNDKDERHCAEQRHGAWWYWHCTHSNLNGRYQNTTDDVSAMSSYDFKKDWRGLSYSRMMIRDILN
ncbi:microfibril-associated glycoprotein 4-like [Anopheles ziemanni]|uniref:microfibril-associated glycoprotein 4-like n=1 Tax=Anopheles coustani TaxID=139045 RepID=UPI002659AD40|nr:microfibril-associated glycoprotein 4-like [Anopheles coustani]XP_058177032.1 microfibril-associated glycoprotein 4-like [Anopheles ziemanni]